MHLFQVTECPIMSDVGEIVVAQVWNGQRFQQPVETTDGRVIKVVYPGVWTHGFGPDFRGAMLDIDGRLATGDVEVELDVRGWYQHGHDRNSDFDNVILQIVASDRDEPLVRRSDGAAIPRVVLPDYLDQSLAFFANRSDIRPLGAIGFDHCAPGVARDDPDAIREIWQRAGDQRMQEKVSAISGDLSVEPPAQVLYERVMDALGYSRNREPMAEVAARLPIDQLATRINEAPHADRFFRAAGLLLGVGGFLPLSPQDAAMTGLEPTKTGQIETNWRDNGRAWHSVSVSPGFWTLARLRPAAHPVRRLLAAAVIVNSAANGIVERLVSGLESERPRQELESWIIGENPWLGKDHGLELIVNVIIPFGLAYGDAAHQPDVRDAAAELWQQVPAGRGNAVTKSTREQICGDSTLASGSARAEQGLIHINRNGCQKMRCYECPIAHVALQWDSDTNRVAAES